ncbi:hypothetical protein [Alteribacillus iranensis]|uniref:Uncharacterized protein n=1 Tax=Alteribacillus iranensis TaxID=930128 RepID=A0A1I2ETP1_9BACI|nr:hypothetical protein [Alteribacillus iranensis]SFE95691.1 hypothetical protein SAMN05192532_106228 [Alteribacillus iranensis]
MEQIQLDVLVEFMHPSFLELLKEEEKHVPIVLQDGLRDVSKTDVQEIVEAVIMERGKDFVCH